MAVNRVNPSQSEMNLDQGQDSNKLNNEVTWVAKDKYKPIVEKQPEAKPIDKIVEKLPEAKSILLSDKTKLILKNIKANKCLCNEEGEEKNNCRCGKNQAKHASNDIGKIKCDSGNCTAKYVVVDSNTTRASTIFNQMKEEWKMEMPNLLISVAGSTKHFENSSLADACQKSLMKAVNGTGAWIITDGEWIITEGKQECVKKYNGKEVSKEEQPNIIIGITQGSWPDEYHMETISLYPHHSHFVLMDDGSEDRSHTNITFRKELENEITKIKSDTDDMRVPCVLLVLEWDQDISKTMIKNAKEAKIPVIIVKASDHDEYNSATESDIPEDISKFSLICEWNSASDDFDIGLAILKALSKAAKNKVWDNMSVAMYKLKLAFAWNRIDIAKNNMSRDEIKKLVDQQEAFMMAAISLDRVEFVDLILDTNFNLQRFLTKKRLEDLYNKVYQKDSTESFIKNVLSKITKPKNEKGFAKRISFHSVVRRKQNEKPKTIQMGDVKLLLEHLLDDSNLQFERYDANIDKDDKDHTTAIKRDDGHEEKKSDDINPCLDLLIWSLLNNRQDMAKLFWRNGKDFMAAALFAHALLSSMSRQIDDKDLKEQCEKHGREFTNLAIGVLKECHKKDVYLAEGLLIQEQSQLGETSCVLIAVKAKNKQFIAEHACQDVFNNIWMGKIDQDNGSLCDNLKLLLCIVFPCLILCWASFKEEEDNEQASDQTIASDSVQTDSNSMQPAHRGENNNKVSSQPREETNNYHSIWQKISFFYLAPVIIFFHNVISYMLFLSLYSYILISKFDRYLSWQEILLCVWVFTIFTQEIIQGCTTPSKNWRSGLSNYIKDGWNMLDMVTLFLFLLGMILRIFDHPQVSESAHIVLGVNLITFYLRLMHIFSVHRELGPKLVMIMHMVINLAYFIMILMVFIVAYGIASHAILYPHTDPSLATLTDIFLRPYWNIYGELMLDKIEGSVDCTNDPELYKTGTYSRCPTESGKYFVPLLMGVYMLMCNILLLNLLIAIFSITFQKVQENSYLYWSFQQYSLINEYANRPFLTPPLIICMHLYQLINSIVTCCKKKSCKVNAAGQNAFLKQNGKDLRETEDKMVKKFLENGMEHNSTTVSEDGSAKLEKRMDNMEKQLNWIVKTLRKNKRGAKMVSGSVVADVEV